MNSNLQSIYLTVVIALVFFTGLAFQLTEIMNKNDNLSVESQEILLNYQTDVNTNLAVEGIEPIETNVNITSGSGEEDFSREFRESQALAQNQRGVLNTVKNLPSIFTNSIGIPQNSQVTFYLSVIGFTLVFMIGLAIYIAWKTGEVKNR